MNKETIIKALQAVKSTSPPRKFTQSYDLIINLRDINIKKNDEQIELYVELPHVTGRSVRICGLVAEELSDQAKKVLDTVITNSQFAEYQARKKEVKKLATQHDYFVAQATIMPNVAKSFGQILGKKGKLPSPKAGCVVPPNADLASVKKRLEKTVKLAAKVDTSIKCTVGNEKMPDDAVAENILAVYNRVKSAVPKEEMNIHAVLLKLTMGAPVKVQP